MAEQADIERVRRLVGANVTDEQVRALTSYHETLAQAVAAFATAELRAVEPPLRSVPGPRSG